MRSEPRFSSWELATVSAIGAPELRRFQSGVRLGRRQPWWRGRWSWLLTLGGTVVVITLVFGLFSGLLGWPLRTAWMVVQSLLAVEMILLAAWLFNYTPPALVRLCCARVRFMKRAGNVGAGDEQGEINAEIARRRRAWASYLARSSGVDRMRIASCDRWARTIMYCSIAGSSLYPILTSSVRPSMAPLAGLLVWIGLIAIFVRTGSVRRRVRAAITEFRCPDCRYPLASLEPRADAAPPTDVWIGPARCPECGCPWPLVPPQVQFEGPRLLSPALSPLYPGTPPGRRGPAGK